MTDNEKDSEIERLRDVIGAATALAHAYRVCYEEQLAAYRVCYEEQLAENQRLEHELRQLQCTSTTQHT